MTRMLTVAEAAQMLSTGTDWVRDHLAELGAVDLSRGAGKTRTIRIPEAAIDRYLTQCTILPREKPRRKTHAPKVLNLELFEADGRIKRRRS